MGLAIALVLLIPVVFLLAILVVAVRRASRMGDETPGWTRVHGRLPIYKFPDKDRPVELWPDAENPTGDAQNEPPNAFGRHGSAACPVARGAHS